MTLSHAWGRFVAKLKVTTSILLHIPGFNKVIRKPIKYLQQNKIVWFCIIMTLNKSQTCRICSPHFGSAKSQITKLYDQWCLCDKHFYSVFCIPFMYNTVNVTARWSEVPFLSGHCSYIWLLNKTLSPILHFFYYLLHSAGQSVAFQCAASVVVSRISCSLCWLSAGCRANIRAASLAGRPNQTLEAGLIGLTYSIKPSIKLPLTIHWGLTASDITE